MFHFSSLLHLFLFINFLKYHFQRIMQDLSSSIFKELFVGILSNGFLFEIHNPLKILAPSGTVAIMLLYTRYDKTQVLCSYFYLLDPLTFKLYF